MRATPAESRREAAGLRDWLAHNAWRIAVLFVGLLLPLAGFVVIADEVHEAEALYFDDALLWRMHALASPQLDAFFVLVSKLGYQWGVIPLDVLVVALLVWQRHWRNALFAATAFVGSAVLNLGSKGIVASSAALAVLLQEGIGDTIRISLTPEPGQPRTQEVIVAQELLQTTGQRAFTPMVTACPGCGRTTSTFFQELAQTIQEHVRAKMPQWREQYDGAENMTLAVMGCIVNGPGESRHANIGISLPGTGETPAAPVVVDGEKTVTLRGDNIAHEFVALIDAYVDRRYRAGGPG